MYSNFPRWQNAVQFISWGTESGASLSVQLSCHQLPRVGLYCTFKNYGGKIQRKSITRTLLRRQLYFALLNALLDDLKATLFTFTVITIRTITSKLSCWLWKKIFCILFYLVSRSWLIHPSTVRIVRDCQLPTLMLWCSHDPIRGHTTCGVQTCCGEKARKLSNPL